ncbi:bifunctional tRNA (5-methylaminomethyl-2-thiouridine)(34)-methyltransferase MnmD/FAD-dependent 5-carboxymethylaminomethyl-2-thiouridine(34) oxidoreductase MnmC [Colwellia sp. E2M01]|uniref:bifunctional tRNA (5-methylaminomethyl-2-thiouridine)(34)-methyltransferase MnmD/FAD-dependent 5-carboxymethylaminomethyl-2-thiouridine(34) oxidoreductase MnmC n=1 Tax=Colwellia sp. E2M01 TaxID=2841561 RepID=UPI001C08D158|nr:bifunctional tRNA (5-methylaminomethyl-2-thiouridine)(34)-methyltransferase MnmD/FAD-dependent 5-carboxymethylaminomethyl-2-thiouridine(34) oxidoreductase MnmC [Colwellia sp. E2M01]MBU2872345.1 bifunctional tRNA (5-methylaminomethyl-2-thiouridine)(34)-methyltransferase MnmD/FAD-dependent 5-carboxymethylaminomethyl-2-thiouridine(34) oxidoreductase MnmC [Colwellia sp. E2M01]
MNDTDKCNNTSQLSYQKDGAPYCERFDDIYFDSESGYAQSDLVFIQKNDIKSRLQKVKNTFTIAETGFGTGLNFLLTLQAYQAAQQASNSQLAPLHFISVEKYPLSKAQLIKSLSILPQLQEFAFALTEAYPEDLKQITLNADKQFTTRFLDDKVQLTLIFDDAANGLSSIKSTKKGVVDAWYLDGFSPAKNPDMWSEALFAEIGRLSKEQASLTTFTVAGLVKRQLRKIGFRLEKQLTHGKKKEMFFGIMQSNPLTNKGYQLRPRIIKPQHVTIIGGGIASACAVYALTKQGIKVTLYCKDSTLAQGGSSNAIGALFPLLHQQSDDISAFYQQAFWRARELYDEINDTGFTFEHQWCGLLEVSYKDALVKRQCTFEQLNTWPKELIHGVNAKQATDLANISLPYGGLFMPNAGWVSPPDLVKKIFAAAQATNHLRVFTDTHVTKIKQVASAANNEHTWRLSSNQGEFTADVLVLCAGADSIEIEQLKALPITPTRGQITSMKSNSAINKLATVICHKGYLTPESNGIHCIGATFQKNDTDITTNDADNQYNLTTLAKCLPDLAERINWQTEDISASKARLRCMSQDHLPLVGAVPDISAHKESYSHLAKDKNWKYKQAAPCIDNLYVLLGLGARGLCSAPLAADILAADLCNTPYPMDNNMLFNLSPNRFIVRDIIKRKVNVE